MSTQVIGDDVAVIVDKTTSTDNTIRIVWEMKSTLSFTPPSTDGGIPLQAYDARISGGKKIVTASYSNTPPSRIPGAPGTITRDSDGTAQELPIETHPGYSGGESEESGVPVINGNEKPGVQSYLVPGIIYRRTEVKSTSSFTEAALTGGVGFRSAPTGVTAPTANAWLKTGITVSETGTGTIVTETWQFSERGWDTDIYPDP